MSSPAALVNRHSHITIILLSAMLGAVLAGVVLYYPRASTPAGAQPVDAAAAGAASFEQAFVNVAARTLPAVVSISAETRGEASGQGGDMEELFKDNPFLEPFFKEFKKGEKTPEGGAPARPRLGRSFGSGWIFREDGYIVTNSHVVRGAERMTVTLHDQAGDKKEYEAKVVGSDPKTELAVIKIDAGRKLPALQLGNSGKAKVGQWVMAVGAPFQLEQTVTTGIISAMGRFLPGQSRYIRIGDVIQTDASINPGNSGGPLVNLNGEVVGINVAIYSSGLTPSNLGIGFAIPADTAATVVPELIENKRVARGWLGVTIGELNENSRDFFGVQSGGVSVEDINPEGPAAKSDLKEQDVIVAVEGQPVTDTWDLQKIITANRPGTTVTLDVVRDKKTVQIKVKLAEMPGKYAGDEEPKVAEKAPETSALGVTVDNLTAEEKRGLGLKNTDGVMVSEVELGGPSAGKLIKGDVITMINRSVVKDPDSFKKALAETRSAGKQYVMVFLLRKDGEEWAKQRVDVEPKW